MSGKWPFRNLGERERERGILYIYIDIDRYIDRYIDRDIEKEKLSENGRPCHANLWNHTQPENPPHLCQKKQETMEIPECQCY